MNIRHLGAVAAIVRSGSVTEAARLVNLTQPAVTQGIAKLEQQLGVSLFERTIIGMSPTQAGRMLAIRADAALRLIASPRVTATQMRAFIALARTGSYAAAAARTRLSEGSLHRAVADLSLGLGQRLTERRGRGLMLTVRGQAVARRFRLAEAELRSAIAELAALQGRDVGRISVGAMPLSRARLLPAAVADFHNKHPQIEIAIAEGSHAELVGPLRDGELDLIVGALRDPPPGDDLIQRKLFVDRPVVLGRARHPLALSKDPVRLKHLGVFPWIMPAEGTPLRGQWCQMFNAAARLPPPVPIESGSVMMIRELLVKSDFLTLLSPDQVAVELEAGWLVKIADVPIDVSRTIGLTVRADWRPTRLQHSFIAALETEARKIESRFSYS